MKIAPVTISSPAWWRFMFSTKNRCGIFRNREGVKPGRWGFYIVGFEFGSRNPGNWFGSLLRQVGCWPW